MPVLSADVDVELDVVDRNNKPPVWDQNVYGPIHIKENVTVGTVVTTVKARFVCHDMTKTRHVTYRAVPCSAVPLYLSFSVLTTLLCPSLFVYLPFNYLRLSLSLSRLSLTDFLYALGFTSRHWVLSFYFYSILFLILLRHLIFILFHFLTHLYISLFRHTEYTIHFFPSLVAEALMVKRGAVDR